MRKRLVYNPATNRQEVVSDANVLAAESNNLPALILEGVSGQTAPLLQLKDELGNVVFAVAADGTPTSGVSAGAAGGTVTYSQGISLSGADIGRPVFHCAGHAESFGAAPFENHNSQTGAYGSILINRPARAQYRSSPIDFYPEIWMMVNQPVDGEGFHLNISVSANTLYKPIPASYALSLSTVPVDGDTLSFAFPDTTAPATNPSLNLVFTTQPGAGDIFSYEEGLAYQAANIAFALTFVVGAPGSSTEVEIGVDLNATVQNLSDAINTQSIPGLLSGAAGGSLNLVTTRAAHDFHQVNYTNNSAPWTVGQYGYFRTDFNRYYFSKYPVAAGETTTFTFRNSPAVAGDVQIEADIGLQSIAILNAMRALGNKFAFPYGFSPGSFTFAAGSDYPGSTGSLILVSFTGTWLSSYGTYFNVGQDDYSAVAPAQGSVAQYLEFVFRTTPDTAPAFQRQVQIGATAQDSLNNLVSAINSARYGLNGSAVANTVTGGQPDHLQLLTATDLGSGMLSVGLNSTPGVLLSPAGSSSMSILLLSGERNIYFMPNTEFYNASIFTDSVNANGYTYNPGALIEGYNLSDGFYNGSPGGGPFTLVPYVDYTPGMDAASEATAVAAAMQAKIDSFDPNSGITVAASGALVTATRTKGSGPDLGLNWGSVSAGGLGPVLNTNNVTPVGPVHKNGAYAVLGILKSIDGTNAVVDVSPLVVLESQEAIPAGSSVYYNYSTGQVFRSSNPITGESFASGNGRPLGTSQTDTTAAGQKILVYLQQNSAIAGQG